MKPHTTAIVLCLAASIACSEDAPPRDTASVPDETTAVPEAPRGEAGVGDIGDIARAYASDAALEPNRVDWSGGNAEEGEDLYDAHCVICHGGEGEGDGLAAAALNPKPRDFTDGTFYIDADANNETGEDVDLARVILEGPAAFGGSEAMQGWKDGFSQEQVRALIAYIRSLSR